jgi:membrane peptidoglycan carboxypeptidase
MEGLRISQPSSHGRWSAWLSLQAPERGSGRAMCRTGTSQDHRDAWFIGFNETIVVGVWVGNDDHSPKRQVDRRIGPGTDLATLC